MWNKVTARKVYVCGTCKRPIYKEDEHMVMAVKFEDGKIKAYRKCIKCYDKTKVNIVQ